MKCYIKMGNLYLWDYYVGCDGEISHIEFDERREFACYFNSGQEAEDVRRMIAADLNIPIKNIKIYKW